jgi:predicted nucleic-acid-binding protein
MRAVDTNVLVRLITRDDARQATSADQFIEGGAWVSMLVLAETEWVLDSVYGVDRAGIAKAVGMLLKHESLALQDGDVVSAALALFRSNQRLEFSDCLMLEIASKAGHTPLGTFDRNLAKLKGAQKL